MRVPLPKITGNKKPAQEVEPAMPRRRFGRERQRDMWWGIFTDLIALGIDGADSLHMAAGRAGELVMDAREIADRAVDEFEKRWVE